MRKSRQEYEGIRSRENENKRLYYEGNGTALAPHTICLSVNNNCFMRCKMCDVGAANASRFVNLEDGYFSKRYIKERRYRQFPLERIKELVDEMAQYDTTFKTNFVEPLIYKHIRGVAEYVKMKGLKYYTITNGWVLSKRAPWLVDIQADVVRASLDGTPEVHDEIRGRPGTFDRTLRGIKELLAQKKAKRSELPVIGVCFTISNFNYFNLCDFMEYLRREGVLEEIYVNFNHLQFTTKWEVEKTRAESPMFDNLGKCSVESIIFSDIDINTLADQIVQIYERYDQETYHYYFSPWLVTEDLKEFYNPDAWMFPRTPCFLPWYAAQIEVDGEVGIYGHCILPSLGNMMNRPFMEVWNSEMAIHIRRSLKEVGSFPGCNRCIGTLYPLRGRD